MVLPYSLLSSIVMIMQTVNSPAAWALGAPRPHPPSPIVGKPFHSHFVASTRHTSASPQEHQTSGDIFRNRRGDVRVEYMNSPERIAVVIYEADGHVLFLEPYAHRFARLSGHRPSPAGWQFAHSIPAFSDVFKDIDRLNCRRIDFRDPYSHSPAGEAWIAENEGIVLSDKGAADGNDFEWSATILDFDEPEASLFEVPRDYIERKE